jgi:integrase/recombinase XerC
MNCSNQPFYRKARHAWYLQVGKKQVKLAENKADAWCKWHEMMSATSSATPSESTATSSAITVEEICKRFLNYTESTASERTAEWYEMYCDKLCDKFASFPAEALKAAEVESLINSFKHWKLNSRHNFARAVARVYRWAEINELIAKNPLKHLKKPSTESRNEYVSEAQMQQIEKEFPEGVMKDMLILAWDTGIRPQEIFALESRHVRIGSRMVVFPKEESKGKKRQRVIYLATDRALEIVQRNMSRHPFVFLNNIGNPWDKNSFGLSLRRRLAKIGIKTHFGAFRKGYCTSAIQHGVDPVTLSKLMGHADTTMISRVYAQVHQDTEFMLNSAKKAKGLLD